MDLCISWFHRDDPSVNMAQHTLEYKLAGTVHSYKDIPGRRCQAGTDDARGKRRESRYLQAYSG